MSCGQISLSKSGIEVDNYFASEIDKHAIQVTQKNFPDTKQLGDVTKVNGYDLPAIDLFIGGSPCQGFSFAGKQLNFQDPRSKLFFEYVRLLKELRVKNPDVLFLLENVKMKQESQDVISLYLGVQPIAINSSLVSAQTRKRLYWTNIKSITAPEDTNVLLTDILQKDYDEKYIHTKAGVAYMNREVKGGRNHWEFSHHSDSNEDKSKCITANLFKGVPYNVLIDRTNDTLFVREATKKGFVEVTPGECFDNTMPKSLTRRGRSMKTKTNCLTAIKLDFCQYIGDGIIRKFTPVECERLQTVPDDYTKGVSDSQRYRMLGNGWTVDVIVHLLSFIESKHSVSKAA